jgi:hypothetical protein
VPLKFRTAGTEFVAWLPKAKGKIVLLSPRFQRYRPSEDWNRCRNAERNQWRAWIRSSRKPACASQAIDDDD